MLDQSNNLSCHLYLFYSMVLLNPDFNCPKCFMLSSFDKVTTGTYNFVSFISNIAFSGLLIL